MDEVAEVYGISPTRLKQLKSVVHSLAPPRRNKAAAGRTTGLATTTSRKTNRGATVRSQATKSSHNGHKKRAAHKK